MPFLRVSSVAVALTLLRTLNASAQDVAPSAPEDAPAQVATTAPVSQPATQPTTRPTLKVGDAAPPLNVDRWIKGKPVTAFEAGTIYVVEFWATWCGPCIAAMPDLSSLQAKYPKIIFIGIDVRETNPALVDPFVRRMGAKMDYRVAADVSRDDGEAGPVFDAWMAASGRTGIPASFVIGPDGKLLVMTHPASLAPKLKAIVAGTFDPAVEERVNAQKDILWQRYGDAFERNDFGAAGVALDGLMHVDPNETPDDFAIARLRLLAARGDLDAAEAQVRSILAAGHRGDTLPSDIAQAQWMRLDLLRQRRDVLGLNTHIATLRTLYDDDANSLNGLAWTLIQAPPNIGFRALPLDLDLVLKIANDANIAAVGQNAAVLDTLARVHAVRGEFDLAVRTEALAIDITKDKELCARFEKSMADYRENRVD